MLLTAGALACTESAPTSTPLPSAAPSEPTATPPVATPTPTPWDRPTATPRSTPWMPTPRPSATPTPTPTPSPTATATLTPRPTPTPTPTPAHVLALELDFEPIVASLGAWDCFFGREEYPEGSTLCGWHKAFSEEGKRPDITYYVMEGDQWTASREQVLVEVLEEISELTGLAFINRAGPPKDTLRVQMIASGSPCGGDPCATYRAEEYPQFPQVVIETGVGQSQAEESRYAWYFRHELLHALFGFKHPFSVRSSVLEWHTPQSGGFTRSDEEMLWLYGDIPRDMEWEEIKHRACIREGGVCARLYEIQDGHWQDWTFCGIPGKTACVRSTEEFKERESWLVPQLELEHQQEQERRRRAKLSGG